MKKMLKWFESNNGLYVSIWGLTKKIEITVYRSACIDRQHDDNEHDKTNNGNGGNDDGDEQWKDIVL